MANYTVLGRYLVTSAHEEPRFGWGIRIEGNKITAIEPNDDLKKKTGSSTLIDASDKIIMPGFVNTHIHMYAMMAHGMPAIHPWTDLYYDLVDSWWPLVEDQMDHESIRVSAELAAATSIRSGVTTICDVMEAPHALPGCLDVAEKVIDKSGLRAVLCFESTERVSPKNAQMGLDENASFIRNHPADKGRISGMMCVHTTFSCSLAFLKKGRQLADKLGSFIHMHLSESQYEAIHCLRTYGKLPLEVYEDIGYLGKDVLASQCVHVRPREIPIMAKHGINVSHQPMSNADPGCGVAPIPVYLVNGINVGIGTDGHTKNHFEVLRSAIHIHRGHRVDGTVMPANTVFDMATSMGARAIGLDNLGSIKNGNLADVVLLDTDFSAPVTKGNLIDLVVYYREPQHVKTVIIDGELVMKDGNLLTLDEGRINAEAQATALRLWEKGKQKK